MSEPASTALASNLMRRLISLGAGCLLTAAVVATFPSASADDLDISLSGGTATTPGKPSALRTTSLKAGTSVVVGSASSASPRLCAVLTVAQRATAATGPSYVIPSTGVVTSWSYAANATGGQVRALFVSGAETSPLHRLITGKSALQTIVPNALNTFSTRVPVQAGQLMAIQTTAPGMNCGQTGTAGDTLELSNSNPDTTTDFVNAAALDNYILNLSVVLESDADGDGYGDVTQQADTKVTKKPKKKSTQRKPKITFSSTIAGSTFTCKVDKKAAKPCTSPFRKKFDYGKHKVVITAVSPLGRVDPTPVTVKFTVVKPT